MSWTPDWPKERPNRGGAPVGQMAELPVPERLAIWHLRLWCSGPDGREAIAQGFSCAFAPAIAVREVNTLADLMDHLITGQRRPIMRHDESCACFGGDESAFANLVAAAVAGEAEDAMAFALTLMRPDAAWQAVRAASGFGLALLHLSRGLAETQSTAGMQTRH